MKLVFVAESFGRWEAVHRHPLVWWSGMELARMLTEAELGPAPPRWPAGVDPASTQARNFRLSMIHYWQRLRETHHIAVTNVFNAHPDGDKTELFFASASEVPDSDLPPIRIKQRVLRLKPEYHHHVYKLYRDLAEFNPNLVVALGNFACWALLGQVGITAIRGTVQMTKIPETLSGKVRFATLGEAAR